MAQTRILKASARVEVAILDKDNKGGFKLNEQKVSIEFDSRISSNLKSVTVNKSLSEDAGTFSFVLAGREGEIITANSLVKIFFNDHLKMIGLVDTANVKYSGGESPSIISTISGRDLAKIFLEQKILMAPYLEASQLFFRVTDSQGKDRGAAKLRFNDTVTLRLNDIFATSGFNLQGAFRRIYEAAFLGGKENSKEVKSLYGELEDILGEQSVFRFADGEEFNKYFGSDFRFVSNNLPFDEFLPDFKSIIVEDVNILNIWKSVSHPPIIEMYFDTISKKQNVDVFHDFIGPQTAEQAFIGPPTATQDVGLRDPDLGSLVKGTDRFELIVRPNGIIDAGNRTHFTNLRGHRIGKELIDDLELSRTDANTYNSVYTMQSVLGSDEKHHTFIPARMNPESIVRYGHRKFTFNLRYLNFKKNQTIMSQIEENDVYIASMFFNDNERYSGTMTVNPDNDYRIGEKIYLDFPFKLEAYIQDVSDTFSYPEGLKSNITFTKGRKQSDIGLEFEKRWD